MQIGVLAKTFVRQSCRAMLDAVKEHGLECVQFNMSCLGLPTLPDFIDPKRCDDVRQQMELRGIKMAAISGTFNMIHPDRKRRSDGLRRIAGLAAACERLGTSVITICTGSRDPMDMWRKHPDNDTPEAWQDLVAAMGQALETTEATGVTLAFEPEVANVVDSAQKARRLLDELRSPRLKVLMDAANLFHVANLDRMRQILDEAFDLLGSDIALAHAKDLSRDGAGEVVPAGQGSLDYDRYLSRLVSVGYDGALILHSLEEPQVDECVAFLRDKLAREANDRMRE